LSGAWRNHRRLILIGAALGVVVLVGSAFAVYKTGLLRSTKTQQGEILSTNEAEAPEPTPTPTPTATAEETPGPPRAAWRTFRYDDRRTGWNPGATAKPPFELVWTKSTPPSGYLEAPPVVDDGVLVYASYGKARGSDLVGIDAQTGKRLWREHYKHGANFAGSPAIADGRGYVTAHDGHMRVHNLQTGALKWQMKIAPAESPPIVEGDYVYFGDGPPKGNGRMRSVNLHTHRVRWSFEAAGTISSGAALTQSTVYFASYGGSVYALNRFTGHLRWRSIVRGARGNPVPFYSTPALSEGLLVVGGNDGSVYALDARTGKQKWRYNSGGYVYSSAAIWNGRVYIGDYAGNFNALGLHTGRRIWRAKLGPILGSATVMAGYVYISTLRPSRTYAFNALSGKRIWSFKDGQYSPLVADGKSVWLAGAQAIHRLAEKGSMRAEAARKARLKREAREAKARKEARKKRAARKAEARKKRAARRKSKK
jgi:outer membrane protein assembly factor BamB